jgi:hypothetical protein
LHGVALPAMPATAADPAATRMKMRAQGCLLILAVPSVQYHLQRGIVFLQVACPMLKIALVSQEFVLHRKISMN